jgi:hypothetical protein
VDNKLCGYVMHKRDLSDRPFAVGAFAIAVGMALQRHAYIFIASIKARESK